jgi:hypothetical protein
MKKACSKNKSLKSMKGFKYGGGVKTKPVNDLNKMKCGGLAHKK